MVKKKYLIIVVLITFCLTATWFLVKTTESQTYSAGRYNPNADILHTGTIGLPDLVALANAYGTTGDPTLPVNVTSMPYDVEYETINFSNTGWVTVNSSYGVPTDVFFCGGYSRMGIAMAPIASSGNYLGNYTATFYLSSLSWNNGAPSIEYPGTDFNMTVYVSSTLTYLTQQAFLTETKAPYCSPYIWILSSSNTPSKWWIILNVYVYLRSE